VNQILISTSSFGKYDDKALSKLQQAGYDVTINPYGRKLTPDESFQLYKNKIGVVAGTETINRELLSICSKLKVISRCGSGIDNVDQEAANRLGIKVCNTPDGPTLAVAELTVGLILSLLRKIVEMDRDLRVNIWQKKMGNLLSGKDIGIIGYGRIGQMVGNLLIKMNCRVRYTDPEVNSCPWGCIHLPIDDLVQQSDIICVHVSGNFKGRPLIGRDEFEMMKNGAWLVNCSRGGVVDETALYRALKSGHLSGAAVDVFEREPYNGNLKELSNIILTPHIGSYAREARTTMEMQAVDNLLSAIR